MEEDSSKNIQIITDGFTGHRKVKFNVETIPEKELTYPQNRDLASE